MFRKMLFPIAALAMMLSSATSAFAEKKPAKPDQASVSGLVKKVDAKSITLAVVTLKGQPAEDQSFPLAGNAKISVLGKEAKASEIVVDKPAQLTLNAEKQVVAIIQGKDGVKGEKGAVGVNGVVKKIDVKANSIVVAVVTQKGQPAEDQTFTLNADVKVSVQGKEAKAGEIVVDQPVQLTLNAEKKVVAINQGKGGVKGEKGAVVGGTLKKIDEKANTIVVAIVTQKGQPAEEQTFTLHADAKISVLGNAAKVGDLKADQPVQLKLDGDKKVVGLFQGDKGGGGINGLVKKIDDKANTITLALAKVKGQPAEEQTFNVAADVKIVLFGKPAKFTELEVEKPANLTLNTEKKVALIAQGKGEKKPK